MARKTEDGLHYFPINADIVHNTKVKLVVAEFGPRAWAVLLPLLCRIYREKGYWIDWLDEDSKILFVKDECSLDLAFANEVVNGFVRRGFFNKTVFDTFGILTSSRIQENYLEAKKRNLEAEIIEDFLLLDDNVTLTFKNVTLSSLNTSLITKNVSIGTQNKRKENRIKENTLERELMTEYDELEKSKMSIVAFIKKVKPKFITPYVDLWNIFASELQKSQVKAITENRKKKFNVRVNEKTFNFINILSVAKTSQFLMTRSFFTFDWIIENPDNYVQILEGKYANDKPQSMVSEIDVTNKHKIEMQAAIDRQNKSLSEN